MERTCDICGKKEYNSCIVRTDLGICTYYYCKNCNKNICDRCNKSIIVGHNHCVGCFELHFVIKCPTCIKCECYLKQYNNNLCVICYEKRKKCLNCGIYKKWRRTTSPWCKKCAEIN
ncbi:MAG: hypothetical protein Satyrvirus17_21 [Satyrvirus sp.]|uniref:Uncharacterized protein n=1 Tax=Satyrvirus sp. TaxID=2487771 RepID=A0A3G5AGN4_9VIRU|nr:MAG: hypothetical protein Satyrvirus17_21 [Satyrvirus sp.]